MVNGKGKYWLTMVQELVTDSISIKSYASFRNAGVSACSKFWRESNKFSTEKKSRNSDENLLDELRWEAVENLQNKYIKTRNFLDSFRRFVRSSIHATSTPCLPELHSIRQNMHRIPRERTTETAVTSWNDAKPFRTEIYLFSEFACFDFQENK